MVTGFEPFGGRERNLSWNVAAMVASHGCPAGLIKAVMLPVSFRRVIVAVSDMLRDMRPDAVLMLGLAPKRKRISVERLAVNLHQDIPHPNRIHTFARHACGDRCKCRLRRIGTHTTTAMSKITVFKQRLARLFDDNLRTSVWNNVFDWVIIGLIVISSLEVFLSTFRGIAERYSQVLHFIDIFTTVVFTIEVTLRIWTADLIDPKYKGFLGRIRYCLSFYGLIDCLSTYTFYLGLIFPIPATAIKVLRVARLLRVFRYMKAFRLLGKAIASKKEELSISMAVLCIITVILSCLLYFAEHNAQPEVCENGWRTLVWAFAQYIGDPGKVADFPMVTFWGQFIAAIVGLLGIAIFAVPAGLIGSGFLEVIEARNHQKELDKNILKLHNAFERKTGPLHRISDNASISIHRRHPGQDEDDRERHIRGSGRKP